MLQFKGRQALFIFRPNDALWTQSVTSARQIKQIPTRITVFPTVRIGIIKITIKNMSAEFVIKTNVVITKNTSIGLTQNTMNLMCKPCFINAF
ncbi:hypothetical protein BJP41_02315 [Candidatus Williamhamiltonella defendens]|uniref:Uncharacterized protein n=1 Tax=Candidatus Williamhamiltonella defendens TaxID=138072 RepID=A0A2D3SYM2_9ENTR|nr:hypothetical protein BJP44_08530 [Candidatus Hamiltonella defensa]ATW29368.1 hypothetical protein BJP41_02315 [Candidatus Hamiltonella defensa]ATW31347.1 hypothetical protein BJP42_02385 [Candidatus Hamiltonella defensa]ATW33347.1 hypothetical protein BJP43_02595 [Candidatus Hamiltonella defensa]